MGVKFRLQSKSLCPGELEEGDRDDSSLEGYIVDISLSLPPLFENRSSSGELRCCGRYPGDRGGDLGGDILGADVNTNPYWLGFITIPWYLRRN